MRNKIEELFFSALSVTAVLAFSTAFPFCQNSGEAGGSERMPEGVETFRFRFGNSLEDQR